MNDTFDYPPILFDRRQEVFALIPAYHELMMLYRSTVLSLTLLCHGKADSLQLYQELSMALRERVCGDAYAWSEPLFCPGFTDWAAARRLDNIFPGENSSDYIGLAFQRADALGDLTAVLYPHPLIQTQLDLMNSARARLQDMERRVCLLLGYQDRAAVRGDPNPDFLDRLKDYLIAE